MSVWRIAVLCAAILLGVDALRINRIEAPEHALTGDTVNLRCEYDLEGGQLHSVKWYHNNLQFYWYRAEDGSWAFPEKDMTVDLATSDEKQVTLKNVSMSLSGKYKCEVSLDGPQSTTQTATHHLTISKGSRIKHLKLVLPQQVRAGDQTAVLECTYELDGVHLDKVKWYKDLAEFYTFQPGHPPIKESKQLPGIRVDLPVSNGKQVVLSNINVDTTGNYRCQVTTDTQPPQSLSADGKLTILNPRAPELQIPTVFLPGDVYIGDRSATLQCHYDLKGEKLNSLKWYKDNQEVYRFTPVDSPQQLVFPLQGVNVDKSVSDNKQLTLTDITQDSAGLYHCEVVTDAPNFLSLQAKQVQLNVQKHTESRAMSKPIISLPENVHVGDKSITLKCDYNLEGVKLYSVKWYKNNDEFYRFLPSDIPHKQVFPLQGINVNITASDDKHLTLTDITKDTADLYRCEVSSDAPLFLMLVSQAQLNVLEHTESRTLINPIILLPENVHVGDKSITLKCDYNLQGGRLYSVKWYKNDGEFYRFQPSDTPEKKVFPLQGINVNITASDDKHLTLTDITKDTADLYKCEVSSDAPFFSMIQAIAQLNILDAEPPASHGNFFNRAYNWLRNKWNDIKPK